MDTVTIGVKVVSNVAQKFGELTKSIFSFRAGLRTMLGALGAPINMFATWVRWLARLRTMFFIFMTVFAVRPIIKFFEDIIEKTASLAFDVGILTDKFDYLKKTLGTMFGSELKGLAEYIQDWKVKLVLLGLEAVKVFATISSAIRKLSNTNIGAQITASIGNMFIVLIKNIPSFVAIIGTMLYSGTLQLFARLLNLFAWLFYEIYYLADESKNFIAGYVKDISRMANHALISVGKAIIEHANEGKDVVGELIATIKKDLAEAIQGTGSGVNDLFDDVDPAAQKLIDTANKAGDVIRKMRPWITEAKDDFMLFFQGVEEGIAKSFKTWKELGKQLGKALYDGMKTFMSDTFLMLMEGNFKKAKDVVISFLESIKKAIADFLADQAVKALVSTLAGTAGKIASSLVSSIFGSGGGGGNIGAGASMGGGAGFSMQHGGVMWSRGRAEMAEGGPEAAVPLKYGKIPVAIKNFPRASAPTQAINQNINIAPTVIDGESFSKWLKKEKNTISNIMVEAAKGGNSGVRTAFKVT